jgi:hypothetical protein
MTETVEISDVPGYGLEEISICGKAKGFFFRQLHSNRLWGSPRLLSNAQREQKQ